MTDDEPITIGGRYELGEPLGRGGMAEVRGAIDTRLGRPVAIKQLRIDLAGDSTFQARFRREAQSAAGLNHPNIVAVYDTGEETDPSTGVRVPYIVMELVEGKTLREVLRDGRKILPERALELTAGVLDALSYSHRAGIVHRDIKPANVMLTPTGAIKVMDFGIARAVADTSATMTQTAAVIGTAQYLSPEQARGETVDARSDIYSAGCLLFELLTGRPPFMGESPVSVAYQHVREQPVPPSSLDDMVTPQIDAITLKSLAKDPADRFQTARDMRDDINRLLAGEQVTAVIPSPTPNPAPTVVVPTAVRSPAETVVRPLAPSYEDALITTSEESDEPEKRNPVAITLLVLLLVLALAAVAFVAYFFLRPTDQSNSPTASASAADLRSVPGVTDLDQEDAETLIRNNGLVPKVTNETGKDDDTVGKVTAQSPNEGEQLPPGSEVELTVNIGPETATIPVNLIGKSRSDVEKALKAAGFDKIKAEKSANEPASATKNQVLDVSPEEGTDAAVGQTIIIIYASGEAEVPDWDGMTRAQVSAEAQDKNLRVAFAEEERTDAAEGTVVDQDPGAGDTVDKGSTIKVTLAKAPKPAASPPASPPASSTSGSPSGSASPSGDPT